MKHMLILLLAVLANVASIAQQDSIIFLTQEQLVALGYPSDESAFSDDPYIVQINEYASTVIYPEQLRIVQLNYEEIKALVDPIQHGYFKENTHLAFKFKDDLLVGITIIPGGGGFPFYESYSISDASQEFIFRDSEFVKYQTSYTNCSRMGSCGCISMTLVGYFKDDNLYQQESLQGSWDCYFDTILESDVLDNLDFWLEVYRRWRKR